MINKGREPNHNIDESQRNFWTLSSILSETQIDLVPNILARNL